MSKLEQSLVAIALLAGFVGSATAQTLPINTYSQRDPRFAGQRMGSSSLTIGNYGCLMTCLSSAYRVSPEQLNRWLSSNGGYNGSGLLNHSVAAAFDGPGGLKYVGPGALPVKASSVGKGIERGAVYIVKSRRFGSSDHWVLVYKVVSGQQAYYMDPWDGSTRRVGDGYVSFGAQSRTYSFQR